MKLIRLIIKILKKIYHAKWYIKLLLILTLSFLSNFMFVIKVHAYVVVRRGEWDNVSFNPAENSNLSEANITNNFKSSGGGYPALTYDEWFNSFDQYWGAGSLNGSTIVVNADYYVLINTQNNLGDYSRDARFTLTSANLRCGIGNFMQGYNTSAGSPEITNFQVTYVNAAVPGSFNGTNHLYRIRYTYKQQIPKNTSTNTNMSCWFNRNPSNAITSFISGQNLNGNVFVAYRNLNFQFAVSDDPNTQVLKNIESSINDLNNTQKENTEAIKDQTKKQEGWFNNLFSGIGGLLSAIIDLPVKLVNLLIDGLITLIVPTESQMQGLINSMQEPVSNLGFVGQILDYGMRFIQVVIGLVTDNRLPSFNLGDWCFPINGQNYCLAKAVKFDMNDFASQPFFITLLTTLRLYTSYQIVLIFIKKWNFQSPLDFIKGVSKK